MILELRRLGTDALKAPGEIPGELTDRQWKCELFSLERKTADGELLMYGQNTFLRLYGKFCGILMTLKFCFFFILSKSKLCLETIPEDPY